MRVCMLGGEMWVEKYRPEKLGDIVGQKDVIGSLEALLKKPNQMPHLMFSGSAGLGKTTTGLCIAKQVLGKSWKDSTLELNASDERGIDMVRERVKKFSRFAGLDTEIPFKIIILDEADEMTSGAQTALRRIIEDTARYCRFIIIANNISKIIDPIQSRCAVFKFTAVPKEDSIARLEYIAKSEKIKTEKTGLEKLYEHAGGDMRHAINIMQAVSSMGGITAENVKKAAGLSKVSDVDTVMKSALAGKTAEAREKMIEVIKVYGVSVSDFLKYAAAFVFKSEIAADEYGNVLETLAKYDYRILAGANPEIQLSAMLAELGKSAKK